jgi:hypothetical protein
MTSLTRLCFGSARALTQDQLGGKFTEFLANDSRVLAG